MESIKPQIKNWLVGTFNPTRRIKTASVILIILAHSLLLHGLVQIWLHIGDKSYGDRYTDTEIYSLWAKHFSAQLWNGELYPRWLQGLNDGIGQPTFFFYPPLVYYVGSLFYFPDSLAANPYFQIQSLAFFATLLSQITFFLWIKRHTSEYHALFSALIYGSFHYNFNICVIVNQSITGQWAFVWIPLVIIATERLLEDKKYKIPFVALTYLLLLLTHLVSALIFSPALLLYLLFQLKKSEQKRAIILNFCAGIILGLCASAIFVLPITDLMPFVKMHLFTSGTWNYSKQFMFYPGNFVLTRDIPSNFWVIAAPMLSYFFYKDLIRASIKPETKSAVSAMLVICVTASIMMLDVSKPIWDLLPLLQMVQFPWRFFVLHGISLPFIAGIYFQHSGKRIELMSGIFFLVACIYTLMPSSYLESNFLGDKTLLTGQQKVEVAGMKKLWREHSFILNGELNPRQTYCNDSETPAEYSMCALESIPRLIKTPILQYNKNRGNFSILSNESRKTEIAFNTKTETPLTLKRAYFHGNVAYTDKGVDIPLSYNEDGMIILTAPKGEGTITISLPYFKSEKIGAAISFISLLIILVVAFLEFIRKKSIHA